MFPISPRSVASEDDRCWKDIIDMVFLVARKLARENGVELEARVARSLLGSVSAEVMNKAPCSVYLVRS